MLFCVKVNPWGAFLYTRGYRYDNGGFRKYRVGGYGPSSVFSGFIDEETVFIFTGVANMGNSGIICIGNR